MLDPTHPPNPRIGGVNPAATELSKSFESVRPIYDSVLISLRWHQFCPDAVNTHCECHSPPMFSSPIINRPKHLERPPLGKQILQIAEPPKQKMPSLERWLTAFVIIGAVLVFPSLYLQSSLIFVIGEGVCLLVAPMNLWLERD